jgi:hypothetical protein
MAPPPKWIQVVDKNTRRRKRQLNPKYKKYLRERAKQRRDKRAAKKKQLDSDYMCWIIEHCTLQPQQRHLFRVVATPSHKSRQDDAQLVLRIRRKEEAKAANVYQDVKKKWEGVSIEAAELEAKNAKLQGVIR